MDRRGLERQASAASAQAERAYAALTLCHSSKLPYQVGGSKTTNTIAVRCWLLIARGTELAMAFGAKLLL